MRFLKRYIFNNVWAAKNNKARKRRAGTAFNNVNIVNVTNPIRLLLLKTKRLKQKR